MAAAITYLKDYRVPEYLIEKTQLTFDLQDQHCIVSSRITFFANPDSHGEGKLFLHGEQIELLELTVDGKVWPENNYQLTEQGLQLGNLPTEFVFAAKVKIYPQNNTALEGLYLSNGMYCTQCEAEGFRRITYYPDRPDVMTEFDVTLIAPADKYSAMLSNGNCVSDELVNGQRIVRWHDPYKKPSYLFAVVVGNLARLEDSFTTCSGREVLLEIYSDEKDIDKCDYAMDSLKRAMRWDEEVYGREYDLDRFMIVAVDHFNMGAMENKGLNVFNTSCVLAHPKTSTDKDFQRVEAVVAHEYFHNWSGNRVTCRDWFQLSLKEGLTVFRDAEFSADMNSRAVKRIEDASIMRSAQFVEDAGPMAHSVRPESYLEISNFYTLTIYEKGAEVVRMLANILGAKLYRQACDLYFDRFDGQAVTCDDFVACMEEVSGKNLSQFKLWYSQAGTPELHIQSTYNAEQKSLRLDVRQVVPNTPGQNNKQAMHIPLKLALLDEKGAIELVLDGDNFGKETVLSIREFEQSFNFQQVEEDVALSLLREFSAPIKVFYDYPIWQLERLITLDNDGFTRWDAMQQLMLKVLRADIDDKPNQNAKDTLLLSLKQLICNYQNEDGALLAYLFELPAVSYIASQYSQAEPLKIVGARERLQLLMVKELELELLETYQDLSAHVDGLSGSAMAARSLRNQLLSYLLLINKTEYVDLAIDQFKRANNMTNQFAALKAVVHSPYFDQQAKLLLDKFYTQWQHESLVINMWLQVQATRPVDDNLQIIQELQMHEAYDQINPNKVRALIASFAQSNTKAFHQLDGKAYQFLAEQVSIIDSFNPQIASRLITPLTQWKNYHVNHAEVMRQALASIAENKQLSKDLLEVLDKSLS